MTALIPARGFAASWAVATSPAPVLNVPDFRGVFGGRDGRSLGTDRCGQVRALEFEALPGTVFTVVEKVPADEPVYRVTTDEYPSAKPLYVDSRFVELKKTQPPPRQRKLPPVEQIVSAMEANLGLAYVWGGNVPSGIDELFRFFYRGDFTAQEHRRLALVGVDCSGLLYHATNGWTPRNTSELVHYGTGLSIAGKSATEIASLIRPLDLIVWNGHVIICLDGKRTIESRLVCEKPEIGVVVTPLEKRLKEIMATRKPADRWTGKKEFVIRRWL